MLIHGKRETFQADLIEHFSNLARHAWNESLRQTTIKEQRHCEGKAQAFETVVTFISAVTFDD